MVETLLTEEPGYASKRTLRTMIVLAGRPVELELLTDPEIGTETPYPVFLK